LDEPPPAVVLSGDEEQVYAAVGKEETAMDSIIERTGILPMNAMSALMRLEMKRLVRPLPGQRYVRMI
jgi:DNA processing protein